MKASAFALAGAVLTFSGFTHGEAIGIASSMPVAASYLGVAAIFLACGKFAQAAQTIEMPRAHGLTTGPAE